MMKEVLNIINEHAIGEVFEYETEDGEVVKLRVEEYGSEKDCHKCFFHSLRMNCYSFCNVEHRIDGISVMFRKVEDNQGIPEEPRSHKNDRKDDKPRWELFPLPDLEDVVRVYGFGAKKYGENTWRKLDNGIERYEAALVRHLVSFRRGEEYDEESKLPALAHLAWNAIAMLAVWHDKKEVEQKEMMKDEDVDNALSDRDVEREETRTV